MEYREKNLKMFKTKIAIAVLLSLVSLGSNLVKIQALEETEKVNPLEIKERDPILPNRSTKRPFSPLERSKIDKQIVKLEREAKSESLAGNEDRSFELWYRILRLKRELDRPEEIKTLGDVGELAWNKSRELDVKIITQRLLDIDREAILTGETDRNLLLALGKAYQQVRAFDPAIAIYEKILIEAEQQQEDETKLETLKLLGTLYLAKFNYAKAAPIYEELLKIARSQNDNFNIGIYLTQLAEIYDRVALPENALQIKQQIQQKYLSNGNIQALVKLKISIAQDYETLQEPEKASSNYQEAFDLAWSLQNLAAASEALEKLASLYLDYNQPIAAIQIYQQLIKVQQQSYDFFGLMNTYDRIGDIYSKQKNFPGAIDAFQRGREIARSLQYQESYFIERIDRVKQEIKN